MYQDKVVLCGASAYEQKYYFNQDFDSLPEAVKKELQIMCVLYTEEIGGILTLEFDENGSLQFKTEALDADAMYDEIGSVLRIQSGRKRFWTQCSGAAQTTRSLLRSTGTRAESFWKRWKCTTEYFSWGIFPKKWRKMWITETEA